MANIAAAASGDFSATATWVGGVVPGSGDIAFSNTFTVTISDTRTVQAISNAAGTSITAGGSFSLLNGCNLACTNANGVLGSQCITTGGLGAGSSAIVAANMTPTASGSVGLVNFSSSGTLTIVGNLTGSYGSVAAYTIGLTGIGTLNIIGNCIGGSATSASAIIHSGSGSANVTGNVTGGSSTSAHGITITGTGSITVTGAVYGASGTSAAGINNNSSGTLTVNGTCQSGPVGPAIGVGATSQITRLSGPFLLGASGNINPVQAASWRWAPTQIPTYLEVATSGGSTKRNLYSADNMPSGGYPTVGNVRQSTVYGPSSEFTGTLAVPAASSVALGVATDNTTGTAILTAANVRAAVGMASANLDTQLAGISAPSAATVASSVWSAATRTLTSGGGASASEVATAVRTELGTELGRIDAAVSSRLAPSGTLARVTLADTVTTLTNAPTVPSAAAIASQVRTELSTELARLDVSTSTRLAAVSYAAAPTTAAIRTELSTELARLDVAVSTRLAPAGTLATVTTLTNAPSVPSAATIASQVRTELTPELARVANCSTVDTTATTIQDALTP
jgi:hypothetical protein